MLTPSSFFLANNLFNKINNKYELRIQLLISTAFFVTLLLSYSQADATYNVVESYELTPFHISNPISSIESITLNYDDFIPIMNSDEISGLSISIDQSTKPASKLQLELYDKEMQIIPHTTFFIKITQDDETLVQDHFHAHSGIALLIIKPDNEIKKWTVMGSELISPIGFTSTKDTFDIVTPYLTEGNYQLYVNIFGAYDEKSVFTEKHMPKFESSFTTNINGEIMPKKLIISENKKIKSPLKQFKSGAELKSIICKSNLELALKSSNNYPICVTPETKEILIERGWAKPI